MTGGGLVGCCGYITIYRGFITTVKPLYMVIKMLMLEGLMGSVDAERALLFVAGRGSGYGKGDCRLLGDGVERDSARLGPS